MRPACCGTLRISACLSRWTWGLGLLRLIREHMRCARHQNGTNASRRQDLDGIRSVSNTTSHDDRAISTPHNDGLLQRGDWGLLLLGALTSEEWCPLRVGCWGIGEAAHQRRGSIPDEATCLCTNAKREPSAKILWVIFVQTPNANPAQRSSGPRSTTLTAGLASPLAAGCGSVSLRFDCSRLSRRSFATLPLSSWSLPAAL